ncbi:MAG: segregation/condensation protein A [Actinobacteria bacterium]|nr:segregation/condensation protein A [Actinomycetota bacterium]
MTESGKTTGKGSFFIEYEDRFSGPVSLLVELVRKKKIDIYDISLNYIIGGFVKFLKSHTEVAIDTLSGFIYTAAILLEIKSGSLIPSRQGDTGQEGELEINILKRREEEYRIYKKIAGHLNVLAEKESMYFLREAPLEEQFLAIIPDFLKDIKPGTLAETAALLFFKNNRDAGIAYAYKHINVISIFDEMKRIKMLLKKNEKLTFREISSVYDKIIDRIVSFLSILELYKNEEIEIIQFENFGNIIIKKT